MKTTVIYEGPTHSWLMFGRDTDKPEKIIDTNQLMVKTPTRSLLLDPGGIELFSAMLAAVLRQSPIEHVTDLFASHQDPDVISSLGLWDEALPKAKLHAPWLWEGFIRHFGMKHIEFRALPDEGATLDLDGVVLQFVPAHYLHSSGNFHVYDPVGKVLFSGDVGAALEPIDAPFFVEDFGAHVSKMKAFHQRWMPSEEAKRDWVARVRKLEIDVMCPQHGRMFRGADVQRFLDWFEALPVGIAVRGR